MTALTTTTYQAAQVACQSYANFVSHKGDTWAVPRKGYLTPGLPPPCGRIAIYFPSY